MSSHFEWWIHIFWQHNCNIIIHFQKKSQFIFWKGLHFCKRLHTFCNELSWYAHKRQICVKGLAASKRTIWRILWLISMLLLTGKFFLCANVSFFVEKKNSECVCRIFSFPSLKTQVQGCKIDPKNFLIP